MRLFSRLQKDAVTKFHMGNRAFVAKNYTLAVTLFSEHAKQNEADYAKCHCRIAECYRRGNVLEKALEVTSGITLVSQGDRQNAEKHYRLALQKDPDYGPALYELSTILPAKSDERLSLLQRVAKVSPTYLNLMELGDVYCSVCRDFESAYEAYFQAIERYPKDRPAYTKIQNICRKLERSEEAEEWSLEWKKVNGTRKSFKN